MTSPRILFVDDDPNILAAYQRNLRKRFSLDTAQSGDDGLNLLDKDGPYAVIIADMQMPGMNGIQFLRRAMEKAPDSVRVMLTGNADQKTAMDAVNQGHVFSFLTKPCPAESLEGALDNAIRQYKLVLAEKELLEETLNGSIKVLTDILAMVDPSAFGRAQRLRDEIRAVARWFGVARSWELELGAMLSQIGSVAIPPAVLERAHSHQSLNGVERDMLVRVPETGAKLLANIPRLGPVAEIVRYQHKNYDGSGFPFDNLSGEEIPIGARILRVLTDLIAIEKNKRTRAEAFGELQQTSGIYDPKVINAVASCFDIFLGAPAVQQRALHFRELAIGHLLAADILTKDGTLVVAAGAKISPPMLQKLHNFNDLFGLQEPIYVQ